MDIDYIVQIWREDARFIAHAMPVDVASFGDTPQAARSAVDEAVRLFVQTAEDHGTLEQVLEESRKSHAATE
jgi:predicted RNase H-like HicB family nuclease